MRLDLHVHSNRHSPCSLLDPVEAVSRARDQGLQGTVITEHYYLWEEPELEALRQQAKLGPDFLVLAAQEVETDVGHVLVFGAEKTITERVDLVQLRAQHTRAALVWAHPFRDGRLPTTDELTNPLLDAVEVLNSNQTPTENDLAEAVWTRVRFVATGGSDAHAREKVGLFPTEFDAPVTNMQDLVEQIRKGCCRPARGSSDRIKSR